MLIPIVFTERVVRDFLRHQLTADAQNAPESAGFVWE